MPDVRQPCWLNGMSVLSSAFNPVPIMQLVEMVSGVETSLAVVEALAEDG